MADADFVLRLFERADSLQQEKAALYEDIARNRRLLRDLANEGVLNATQTRRVHELYPPKLRSGEDEDENGGGE